ncbi:DUF4279 domain-containing protein [Luteimicrobium subarcticum]|uniref:DUF4279 domain-containing protein n=1 Tax=Luteimicrobium subarcticum TaxID=620910 RepID=UPI000C24026E|nr:DUF4279 domain-containing protein [Luteimicrobium subarcticum]
MSAFRSYLRVVSSTLDPDDISDRLASPPDEATARGSRKRPELPPRTTTTWTRNVTAPVEDARPEDFEPVILAWGPEFARALGSLVTAGDAFVALELVQEIRDLDSSREKGIFLSPELLAWLATSHASLDIDQYIFHDCSEDL